jgi:hypothetical protein
MNCRNASGEDGLAGARGAPIRPRSSVAVGNAVCAGAPPAAAAVLELPPAGDAGVGCCSAMVSAVVRVEK